MVIKKKNGIALLLAGIMILSGCSSGAGSKDKEQGEDTASAGGYVETEYALPEDAVEIKGMRRYEDGTLYLFTYSHLYTSSDEGATWDLADDKASILGDDTYGVWDADMDAQGNMFFSYYEGLPDGTIEYKYLYVTKDGEEKEIDLDLPESEDTGMMVYQSGEEESTAEEAPSEESSEGQEVNFLFALQFAENGDVIATDLNSSTLYQIDLVTGEIKNNYTSDLMFIQQFFIVKNQVLATDGTGTVIYDLESHEELTESESFPQPVLDQFTANDSGSSETDVSINMSGGSSIILAYDEEAVYYVNEEGLYRCAFGGSSAEQVINGASTSISNPAYGFVSLLVNEDNSFSLLTDSKVFHYTYSDTVTVPDKELTIYALSDSQNVRQAISSYRQKNPDVNINFEVGLTGEDGVTAPDAIRTLNTDIMAGNGPDIIILDGMPLTSYIEKGMLMDITDVTDAAAEEGVFENIVRAYESDGRLYAVPTRFQIPIVTTDADTLSNVSDLSTLTEQVEKLRADNPNTGNILQNTTAGLFAGTFFDICAAAWQKEDGTIDEKGLKEFLTDMTNIYQAHVRTKTEEEITQLEEDTTVMLSSGEAVSENALTILLEGSLMGVYPLVSMEDLALLLSVNKKQENWAYTTFSGQSDQVFLPSLSVGINAKTEMGEETKSFVQYLLSEEAQKNNLDGGFPVNQKAFDALCEAQEYGESYSVFSFSKLETDDETGEELINGDDMVEVEEFWPEKQDFDTLKTQIESLKTPALTDTTIKDAVVKEAAKCMKQEVSADEAAETIMQAINLYLAE